MVRRMGNFQTWICLTATMKGMRVGGLLEGAGVCTPCIH